MNPLIIFLGRGLLIINACLLNKGKKKEALTLLRGLSHFDLDFLTGISF